MKNILFAFANQLIALANQMIEDLIFSDGALLMTVFFAGLLVFMISAFMSIQVSTNSSLMNNRGQGAMEYLMTYGWAILVVMIVGVVLWQLGVFNVGQGGIVVTGFVKMQPLTPSVAYRNVTFTASLTNALGTSIRLDNITLNETVSGSMCTPNPTLQGQTVKAGGTFTINSGTCPSKSDGDAYDMVVTIRYNATMGGITTRHTDTGHVKGQGEAW